MRVYLAAQIFSATVAAGMEIYLSLNKLLLASNSTIQFLRDRDKLFDMFNFYFRPKSIDFNRPIKNTEAEISHLSFMKNLFSNCKVLEKNNKDVTNRMKCIKGWLISIAVELTKTY